MPKILSDFKDIAVYRKGGVSHLDMEVQSLGDASVKTQDLEDSRRELIALSGVKWNTHIENQSLFETHCQIWRWAKRS